MKSKTSSSNQIIEMSKMSIPSGGAETKSSANGSSSYKNGILPSLKVSTSCNNPQQHPLTLDQITEATLSKVSEWFDTDGCRKFINIVKSGDIVEVRNSRVSHWGVVIRLRQPPSPNGRKQEADEIMVYHLVHSTDKYRGQIGQYTLEDFWDPLSRIRVNNSMNGMRLYGKANTIPKADILDNAFTAHMSSTLKWQTCNEFIRWTCAEETHPHHPSPKSSHVKEN